MAVRGCGWRSFRRGEGRVKSRTPNFHGMCPESGTVGFCISNYIPSPSSTRLFHSHSYKVPISSYLSFPFINLFPKPKVSPTITSFLIILSLIHINPNYQHFLNTQLWSRTIWSLQSFPFPIWFHLYNYRTSFNVRPSIVTLTDSSSNVFYFKF